VRGGYDGRGVWVLADERAARRLTEDIDPAVALLVEAFVPIEREVAVLVARRSGGESAVYPVVETVQRDGICHELIAAAPISSALAAEARRLGVAVAEARLSVNELAARPHTSGHFTIEGCTTSQFEQHLRAVLDWPLGATDLVAPAVATVNVLGGAAAIDPRERLAAALAVPGAHVHLYGKGPRPGRKLGHVTVLADDAPSALERAREAARRLVDERDEGTPR
jgi:5-(carboxyamino)imidazole ribonucleotide synthase